MSRVRGQGWVEGDGGLRGWEPSVPKVGNGSTDCPDRTPVELESRYEVSEGTRRRRRRTTGHGPKSPRTDVLCFVTLRDDSQRVGGREGGGRVVEELRRKGPVQTTGLNPFIRFRRTQSLVGGGVVFPPTRHGGPSPERGGEV